MNDQFALIKTKIGLSARTVFSIMKKPKYLGLVSLVMIMFFELTYWLFNLNILTKILTSGNITLLEKGEVLLSPIEAIGTTNGSFQVIMMLVLSALQGIMIAALTYVIRNQKTVDAKLIGGSTIAGLLAVIGLGCPSCGTSLITPIVAIFISGSATSVSESITNIALPVAILVALFGLYVIGLRAANVRATTEQVGTVNIIRQE